MPAVPGVLLDPVDQDLADRDPVRAEPLPEVRVPGQHRVGRGLLARQVRVRLVDHALVGDRAVEVRVVPPYSAGSPSSSETHPRHSRSTSAR